MHGLLLRGGDPMNDAAEREPPSEGNAEAGLSGGPARHQEELTEKSSWVERQGLLRSAYYVACRSRELGPAPLRRRLLDRPVVLYRSRGSPVAFVDRCPHRNVPLSAGCTSADGSLRCAYHGWRFDEGGRLIEIPGRTVPLPPDRGLTPLAVREEGGLVWVCPTAGAEPAILPYLPPLWKAEGYTHVLREVSVPGAMFDVAENALDVPHTAVLHGGLFRKDNNRTRIRCEVRRYRHWVEAQYHGEAPPKGLVARLLAVGTRGEVARVDHIDRFFLPAVLQVEYRLSHKAHFMITGLLTPDGEASTRLYALASFRTPLPGRLLALVLEPFARLIFRQDQRMLARQARNLQDFGGPRYRSSELDVLGPQIRRLLLNQLRAEQGRGHAEKQGPIRLGRAGTDSDGSEAGQTPVHRAEIELEV